VSKRYKLLREIRNDSLFLPIGMEALDFEWVKILGMVESNLSDFAFFKLIQEPSDEEKRVESGHLLTLDDN